MMLDGTDMSTPVTRGELREELAQLENRFDQKLEKLEQKLDQKLEKLDSRFDQKLEKLDQKFDSSIRSSGMGSGGSPYGVRLL